MCHVLIFQDSLLKSASHPLLHTTLPSPHQIHTRAQQMPLLSGGAAPAQHPCHKPLLAARLDTGAAISPPMQVASGVEVGHLGAPCLYAGFCTTELTSITTAHQVDGLEQEKKEHPQEHQRGAETTKLQREHATAHLSPCLAVAHP